MSGRAAGRAPGFPGVGGRPSGSGGPLGRGRPVEPPVGIAGRFDRAPSYRCIAGRAAAGSGPAEVRRIVWINV